MQIITKESRAAYTNIRQSRLSVKSPSRDKEGIDIMRKGSILQEKMKTTLNKYDKFKVDIYNYFIIC